jgi:hypothetical protein
MNTVKKAPVKKAPVKKGGGLLSIRRTTTSLPSKNV